MVKKARLTAKANRMYQPDAALANRIDAALSGRPMPSHPSAGSSQLTTPTPGPPRLHLIKLTLRLDPLAQPQVPTLSRTDVKLL